MADIQLNVDVTQKSLSTPAKSPLLDFVTSAGGTALVTVLLGGVVAQLVSCDAQRRSQERDFNNSWLKSRGDQALVARKEFVDSRRASLDEILRTIGDVCAASKELIDITQPSFLAGAYKNKSALTLILAEQTRVANEFTKAELAWEPSQQRFSFLVAYFARGDKQSVEAWNKLRLRVNEARKCSSSIYIRWHMAGRGIGTYTYNPQYCEAQQALVTSSAELFGKYWRASQGGELWAGWDNPDSLKDQLHIRK
jgi:hypothetical protein